MRKKIFVIAMVLTLTVAGGVVVAAGAGSGSSENVSATSASGTSVDEYEMYLVEDNPDLCVYSMRPNKTLLLIGASDWANYETYANVHTEEITGSPVALADDLSKVRKPILKANRQLHHLMRQTPPLNGTNCIINALSSGADVCAKHHLLHCTFSF